MRSKKSVKYIDDGRVISPMNVEGMPWFTPKRESADVGEGAAGVPGASGASGAAGAPAGLSRRENLAFAFGVLKAVGLVTLVFVGVLFLFVLFCTNVWLR